MPGYERLVDSLSERAQICYALSLRDLRTRFGRSYLGYLVAIAWPLTHLVALVILMGVFRAVNPMGGSGAIFIATGVVPYVLCLYPARMISGCVDASRPLFYFPVVRSFDVIVARVVVEFLTAFVVLAIFLAGATVVGFSVIPNNLTVAAIAVFATVYLSIAIGLISIILIALTRFWHMGLAILMIPIYISAGIFIAPQIVPATFLYWMSWNPLFHCVLWLRSAYYDGFADGLLDKNYLLAFSTVCLFAGLAGERFMRGKVLVG